MKKSYCAIILVAVLLFLAIGITLTFENSFNEATRVFVFNSACKAITKAGIEVDKDHCLKWIAVFMKDPSICEKITGERFSTEYQGVKFQLENPPKMECLTEIAAEKNDPSICDKVVGLAFASTKIDCLYRVAAKNNNASACNIIGDKEQSRMGMKMNQAGCLAQLKSK